jgi:hypothetical protein
MKNNKSQAILPFLPGYMFDGRKLVTTGAALPPTQHIHPLTGEVIYYVRPLFEHGSNVGMFIRHRGIIDWFNTQGGA